MQATKELLENSFDATGMSSGFISDISVNMRQHEMSGLCILEVLDNGKGINDIKQSLEYFFSTKCDASSAVGKFGVGLKAVILYAQLFTRSSVRSESLRAHFTYIHFEYITISFNGSKDCDEDEI